MTGDDDAASLTALLHDYGLLCDITRTPEGCRAVRRPPPTPQVVFTAATVPALRELLEHGYDPAKLAAVISDFGSQWQIEHIDPGTTWIALSHGGEDGLIRVVAANDLDSLRGSLGRAVDAGEQLREAGLAARTMPLGDPDDWIRLAARAGATAEEIAQAGRVPVDRVRTVLDADGAQLYCVNPFDVRVFAIRRRQARRPYEVRWRVASRDKSKSFITRALADSYRAELIRAARKGLEFDPVTGEPVLWAIPEPVTMTWYQHAVAYADMKWPSLAAHSRASMAEALATLTPALTKATARRPPARALRAALYGHAFNPQVRAATPDPATVKALAWLERASLAVQQLSDPRVVRAALDALTLRLDGTHAAANTISRKRAVFYNALGYAVELGLLPVNPVDQVQWRAPVAACTVNPQTVASPVQVRAILSQVTRIRPELTAFFGCLYYAALRPEEAVALRREHLILPAHGRGKLVLTGACPRTGAAWTITGTPYEPRGLKHRPDGAIRVVPVPPVLVTLLRRHLRDHGTAPDGRLFRGARGGMLSESLYGRIWHAARDAALGPVLAAAPLARRPYDLRHAALSLWLSASAAPGEVAARAGNSISVLQAVYVHCIDGQEDITNQRIEEALGAGGGAGHTSPSVTASGPANRRSCPDAVRHTSAHSPRPAAPCTGTRHRASQHRAGTGRDRREFPQSSGQLMARTSGTEPQTLLAGGCRILPTHSPRHPCRRCADRSCSRSRPDAGESSTPGLTCGYHCK